MCRCQNFLFIPLTWSLRFVNSIIPYNLFITILTSINRHLCCKIIIIYFIFGIIATSLFIGMRTTSVTIDTLLDSSLNKDAMVEVKSIYIISSIFYHVKNQCFAHKSQITLDRITMQ